MAKPLLLIPVVVFAAMAGLFAAGLMRDNAGEIPSTFVGQQAPGVPVDAVPGTTQIIDEDLRTGEVTVVNFWASWCPPCHLEHPTLLALDADGVRIAGMNFRDASDDAATYLERADDPFFATGFDLRGRNAIDWGVTAPPETFIVDGDGVVLYRFIGPLVDADFENRFRPELEKALGRDLNLN